MLLLVKLHKIGEENLQSYNELLKRMFVEDKIDLLDKAILDNCGVKLRNTDKLIPTLQAICEGFHEDQVNLRF